MTKQNSVASMGACLEVTGHLYLSIYRECLDLVSRAIGSASQLFRKAMNDNPGTTNHFIRLGYTASKAFLNMLEDKL